MSEDERKMLAKAAIPLEALCINIKLKPYKELGGQFQKDLLNSLEIIRGLLFENKENKKDLTRMSI